MSTILKSNILPRITLSFSFKIIKKHFLNKNFYDFKKATDFKEYLNFKCQKCVKVEITN